MSVKNCFEGEEEKGARLHFRVGDVTIARISLALEFLTGLVVNLLFFEQGS